MINLKYSAVLPNFLKILLIATFSLSANVSIAGHHEEAKDKIRDLKDMTSAKVDGDSLSDQVRGNVTENLTDDISDEAVDGATERAKEMSEEAKEAITDGTQKKARTLSIPEG